MGGIHDRYIAQYIASTSSVLSLGTDEYIAAFCSDQIPAFLPDDSASMPCTARYSIYDKKRL